MQPECEPVNIGQDRNKKISDEKTKIDNNSSDKKVHIWEINEH